MNFPACAHCNGSGILSIWSGKSIAEFKSDGLRCVRTVAVACCCKRGERYLVACKKWRFDPLKMFPWNGDNEQQRELLRDFLERKREATVAAAAWNPDEHTYPGGEKPDESEYRGEW